MSWKMTSPFISFTIIKHPPIFWQSLMKRKLFILQIDPHPIINELILSLLFYKVYDSI